MRLARVAALLVLALALPARAQVHVHPSKRARNTLLRVPFNVTGCYPSGSAMGSKGEAVTVVRASTATYTDDAGLVQTCAANQLRVTSQGAQVELATTNMALNSEAVQSWLSTAVTITPDATAAPSGAVTADKVAEDTANSLHRAWVTGMATTISTSYAGSVYLKPAGRTRVQVSLGGTGFVGLGVGTFNLSTCSVVSSGTGVTSTASFVGSWCRVGVVATAVASGGGNFVVDLDGGSGTPYTGDGTSGVYVWGAQVEVGTAPTSYIATAGTSASRSADVVSVVNPIATSVWCVAGTFSQPSTWLPVTTVYGLWVMGVNSIAANASYANVVSNLVELGVRDATARKKGTIAPQPSSTARVVLCNSQGTLSMAATGAPAQAVSISDTGAGVAVPVSPIYLGTRDSGVGGQLSGFFSDFRVCKVGAPKGDCR